MLINFLLLLGIIFPLAESKVFVKIGSPEFKKPLLAIYSKCSQKRCPKSSDIESIVKSDMVLSNTFIMLPEETMPLKDERGRVESWRASGAEYLALLDFDEKTIKVRLLELNSETEVFNKKLDRLKSHIDTAHSISDLIFSKLTGRRSIFNTKIVFVGKAKCRRRRKGKCEIRKSKNKNLFIMDYDGRRIGQITFYNSISISPAWSPDGKGIAYSRYARRYYSGKGKIVNQNLYIYDIETKSDRIISGISGQNSGAAWSPDGRYLAFTSGKGRDPDIYYFDFKAKKSTPKPLITRRGLDLEPSFSPDGKYVVFSSSRTGNPELYKVDFKKRKAKRLTYVKHYNSSPSWSPAGTMIAFSGLNDPFDIKKSSFDIFLISPSANRIERLTIASGNNEDPSWSHDGRHLVFTSTRNGGSDIYIINSDGTGEKRLTKGIKCYSPDWSPFLQ